VQRSCEGKTRESQLVIILISENIVASKHTELNRMEEGKIIGGVYEVVVGTTDPQPLIEYWQQFGYHVECRGELQAADAFKLYGVDSSLKSIRLGHQNADHGLIRLFGWEKPKNDGLQLASMKIRGNRWGAALTTNMLKIENHLEEAKEQQLPIVHIPSTRAEIYPLKTRPKPFIDQYPCVRELFLIQPLTRQVFFQRFDYQLPFYGQVNDASFFQTSQITHVGMIITDKQEYLRFYDEVLGFRRSRDEKSGASTYENLSSRLMFDLQEHESYATTDFDDPRSTPADFQQMRSGRLKIIRFSDQTQIEDRISCASPGSLGYSLYTLRVSCIQTSHRRIEKSDATQLTEIMPNEFGELSFSFIAPDGYSWTILQGTTDKN
jgi:catechol 2,3-dioxygenase-like lactoylglutathione lyase family enzyme